MLSPDNRYQQYVQQAVEHKGAAIGTLVHSNFSRDDLRTLKRKWVDMAGVEGPEKPLLTLGLGRYSPSSSENSCMMSPSSVKETDEESSMDLGLNFDLCLGHDTAHLHKKPCAGPKHVPSARLAMQYAPFVGPGGLGRAAV